MSKARPLLFSESSRIADWQALHEQKFQSKACQKAANAYKTNLKRSHSLTLIPGYAFMVGVNWQESMAEAKARLKKDDESDASVLALATRLYFHLLQNEPKEKRLADLHSARSNIEITMSRVPTLRQSLAASLEGMIIQAWSAYEVLAGDLWHEVLKERPSIDPRPFDKKIKNLTGLQSRKKIAVTYRMTFTRDSVSIVDCIDNHEVQALAMVRNVLVHCGGAIDDDFIKNRKGFDVFPYSQQPMLIPVPGLLKIRGRKKGYKIQFSGPMVRHFIDPVTPHGFGLVKAVDEWLIRHP